MIKKSHKAPTLAAFCSCAIIPDLRGLIEKIQTFQGGDDRRADVRVKRNLLLEIQPLDSDLEPLGDPFRATTRDVSKTGLGFLHSSAFPTEFVRIRPNPHSRSQALGRVCYNKVCFGSELMYLVGVEYLDEPPECDSE